MKKLLGILLLTFVIIAGFSGTVSAAHHNGKTIKVNHSNSIVHAPTKIYSPINNSPGTTFAPINNSPSTTFVKGNYNSYTGQSIGNTANTIGSTTIF